MISNVLSTLALASALAASVQGKPVLKRGENIDTTILQYALTLEHLENAFYSEALSKFDEAAFTSAGYPAWVRKRIVQIGQHEAQHVTLLSGALGSTATKPCTYSFPYDSVTSFLGLSSAIENVGVAAYLGAANQITDKDYVTVAGSILTVESRHQGWVNAAALKGSAWNGPEDTPLSSFSQVYSIASAFITACPDTNPALPVKAFPVASVMTAPYKAGDTVTLSYTSSATSGENLILYQGLTTAVVPITADKKATLPSALASTGTVYAVISTAADAKAVSDDNTVAGPIILSFPISSSAPVAQ